MRQLDILRRIRNIGVGLISRYPLHPTSTPSPPPSLAASSATESDSDEPIMGKSNKFDYTNRTNSGAKLGQIIGHALEKEADKLHKDAQKQASKTRKASTGSDASPHNSDHFVHVLDIKAPGKQLGDEGVGALAAGLESALQQGNHLASLALEDLNLSDNGITTASLVHLAPIISSAKHDLKTINLSHNRIKVETTEEARQWEIFLESFRGCFKLRRLDLSDNESLGAKALEILLRVHLREDPINPLAISGDDSVHTLADSASDDGNESDSHADRETTPTQMSASYHDLDLENPMGQATLIKRRRGLRSIPYITLQNIGMTDAGALWLSYTLEDHYYPNQLVDELNAIVPDSNIKTYQQNISADGIEWMQEGATLGKDGLNLLKHTEILRAQRLLDDRSILTSSTESLEASEPGVQDHNAAPPRKSVDRGSNKFVGGNRRVSIRSIRTNDGGEHEASEIESTRKKIQRSIIAQHGAASVDLWRAALKTVGAYRILMFSRPAFRRCYHGPPQFDFTRGIPKRGTHPDAPPRTPTKATGGGTPTYASTLLAQDPDVAPGEPELVITDVTNTPRTPKILFKPHRKGGFSEGSDDLRSVTHKLEGLVLPLDPDPQRFVHWQEERRAALESDAGGDGGGADGDRDCGVPSHLPPQVIDRIVDFVLAPEEREAMTADQRGRAYAWARDRRNFETAREWRKMADSAQVWTLLESIGCLNYGK